MSTGGWDATLDGVEHALVLVEDALLAGQDVPALPPFHPPDALPTPVDDAVRRRLRDLHRRHVDAEAALQARAAATAVEVDELRRRRHAAQAYAAS